MPTAVRCHDRDDPTAAAGRPERGVESVEDGRDAPPGSRAPVTAKTQRWNPEEFLRTLVEAEITARDESKARTRLRLAAFPVTKTLTDFDVAAS